MAGAFNIRIYSKYLNFVLFLKLLLKHLQSELQSLESVYNRLVAQTATLYTTASDERVKTLKEDHEQLENRWKCQTTAIPQRSVILNGSYDAFLQIIILCTWCNRICCHALMLKNTLFQILYIIVVPLQ